MSKSTESDQILALVANYDATIANRERTLRQFDRTVAKACPQVREAYQRAEDNLVEGLDKPCMEAAMALVRTPATTVESLLAKLVALGREASSVYGRGSLSRECRAALKGDGMLEPETFLISVAADAERLMRPAAPRRT